MILVDSNIPMYLVGAPHPLKARARLLLERLVANSERLVTDVEVLQEILHRYSAIRRIDAVDPAFEALLGVVDEVFPVQEADVISAKRILLGTPPLSARDALHVAIMERHEVEAVLSFDRGFDAVPSLRRIGE